MRCAKQTGIGQGFSFFDDELASGTAAGIHPPVRRDGAESERIAERWLSTAGTSRAFLFLHLDEPHAPYAPPPPFDRFSSPYDGEVAYADEIVGRLVSYLKKQQLYDQSTIILVADHGESLGAHGEQQHGLFVYDDTIRVPLIIKQAAGEGAGHRVRDVVQQVDLVPTILDFVRAPVPGNLRGRSLKPLLEGGELPARLVVLGVAVRALPVRLEPAVERHRRTLSLHQRADRRAVRSRSRSRLAVQSRRSAAS